MELPVNQDSGLAIFSVVLVDVLRCFRRNNVSHLCLIDLLRWCLPLADGGKKNRRKHKRLRTEGGGEGGVGGGDGGGDSGSD